MSTSDPTADPGLLPRAVAPSPALAHPATRDQHWRQHHYWAVIVVAVVLDLAVVGGLHDWLWVVIAPFAVLVSAIAVLVDEVPRQRRWLRKRDWVEYPVARVSTTTWTRVGSVNVELVDGEGRAWSYQCDPNDLAFEEGDRPVWVAGTPGDNRVVVSLREGACTGFGYRRWVGNRYAGTSDRASVSVASTRSVPQHSPLERPATPWSRALEPAPAAEHPATKGMSLPVRDTGWVAGLAAVIVALLLPAYAGPAGLPHPQLVGIVLAVLLLAAYVLLGPARRQRSLLRRHPWVEHGDAVVTIADRTRRGDVLVDVATADGVRHRLRVDPADRDFTDGPRPVWVAGPLDGTCVVSLREGRCTGLARATTSGTGS